MEQQKLEIDLTGPEGNAYVLMGYARTWGRQLGWSQNKINALIKVMMSSNYEVLVQVFDNHFGDYVTLWR
jgi:hypothetical protein|tara:strand:+ start:6902 stop:7111 length:210 start_codon:yes stop_codon:yes gene_type:complete